MNRSWLRLAVVAVVAVLAVTGWVLSRWDGFLGGGGAGRREGPLQGQVAPDWTLTDLEGQEVRLADLRGKPVFMNLWATWCPPCRWEMPFILEIQEEHPEAHVLAVNVGESEEKAGNWLVEQGLEALRVPMDIDSEVYSMMHIRGMPTSFFLDADGSICVRYQGAMTKEMMKSALATAREGC